jgi:hypothetical protein
MTIVGDEQARVKDEFRLLAVVAALAVALPATAATTLRVIGSARSSGDFAVAAADGKKKNAKAVYVRGLRTRPVRPGHKTRPAPRTFEFAVYRRFGAATVTVNRAVVVFALVSPAEQRTVVRPIRKRLPDFGAHTAETGPSTASVALTLNDTRANFPAARAVLGTAPVIVGGVRSKSRPETTSVPLQVSVPCHAGPPPER